MPDQGWWCRECGVGREEFVEKKIGIPQCPACGTALLLRWDDDLPQDQVPLAVAAGLTIVAVLIAAALIAGVVWAIINDPAVLGVVALIAAFLWRAHSLYGKH